VQQPTRQLPESLLTECGFLTQAGDGKLSTILRVSIERLQQYEECKAGKKALIDFIRNEHKK
jgi:hypothetical protein